MRVLVLLVSSIWGLSSLSQSWNFYYLHPFGTCTIGSIIDQTPPLDQVDSIVWSTGHTGFILNAPAGSYDYTPYHNGVSLGTYSTALFEQQWTWYTNSGWWAPGMRVFELLATACCGPSNIHGICCSPQPSGVIAELYQDGLIVESQTNWFTGLGGIDLAPLYNFVGGVVQGYPGGHIYHMRLVDVDCGQMIDTDTIIVPGCSNLNLNVQITGSLAATPTGVIDLIEAVPDTTEPYPLIPPVFGSAWLTVLPSNTLVGASQYGTSATWSMLDSGYYELRYIPDAWCVEIRDTLYIPSTPTNITDENSTVPLLYYDPLSQQLILSKFRAGSIYSAEGKLMMQTANGATSLSLSFLPAGSYLFVAEGLTVPYRFVKQ